MLPTLRHIDTWIFDLDNTLYPASCDLFALIDQRMNLYLRQMFNVDAEAAHKIQKQYFWEHGTTLSGLMSQHGTDPHHFLDFVHDIEMDRVSENPALRAAISNLPGRKIIFTNADAPYAERVLTARGLDNVFEDVFDIHRMQHMPKPFAGSYDALCSELRIDATRALFVEDSAHNLVPAKALGMRTIWVKHEGEADSAAYQDHIDHEITDVTQWLSEIHSFERAA